MPHFIRTRLFEKAPFFVLIDRTTGGVKLKKASNINGFRIKDNSVRSEGSPSRSPVLQALIVYFQSSAVLYGGAFFATGCPLASTHSVPASSPLAAQPLRVAAKNSPPGCFLNAATSRTSVQQALNCTFYTAKALKTPELSNFRNSGVFPLIWFDAIGS